MTKRMAWMLGLGLLLSGGVARADDEGGAFSIGGRGVLYSPMDGEESWSGGVQARLQLPLFFAIEASVDHRESDVGDTSISDWPFQLSALMYVLPEILRLQPFLILGGGWYNTSIEGPGGFDETDSRFGPHAGAGLEFNLSSHWFLDATYRYVWIDEFQSIDVNQVVQDLDDSGHMVTLGANYRF